MDDRLNRLVALSGMVRDHRLGRLTAAVARRDAVADLRDGLAQPATDDPAALQAQAAYGRWADRRHAALTAELAAHEAEVQRLLHEARRAFARAQAVEKIRDQLS